MAGFWVRGFGVIFSVCVGCSGESKRDPDEPSIPLVPGTCVNTDCSWPDVQPFQPGPEVACAATEGAPIEVEWSAEARKVSCAGAECVAAPFDVAAGPNGEVWTTARLLPGALPQVDNPVGFELLRNTATGALELDQTTHEEQPLHDPTLDTVGLSVTPDGELEWVGPSRTTDGLSLLHYDRAGALESSRWLVEHAIDSRAHFGPHGITMAYRYAGAIDTNQDPPEVVQHVGIARFDPKGDVRWNQAAFAKVNVPLAGIFLIGVSADGGAYASVKRESSSEAAAGILIVRLSTDGSIDWVREMDTGAWMGVTNPLADTVFVMSAGNGRVDAIDSSGNGLWRTSITTSTVDGIAVSAEGRVFLRGSPPDPSFVLSSDASSCTRHSFDLQTYLPLGQEFWTKTPVFAALSNERLAFAYSGRGGVLKLP